MAEKNENIEFIAPEQEENELRFSFREIFDGSILTRKSVTKQLPFILFLTFLAVIYIGNRYKAEKLYRKVSELHIEVENLRTEQIITSAHLMKISTPSSVLKMVQDKDLELKPSTTPPKILTRQKE